MECVRLSRFQALSLSLSLSLSFVMSSAPAKKSAGMPDVRPKIHRPTTNPIKSRLKSVLGVRSSCVERNNFQQLDKALLHILTLEFQQ